jgi:hypothetical protein
MVAIPRLLKLPHQVKDFAIVFLTSHSLKPFQHNHLKIFKVVIADPQGSFLNDHQFIASLCDLSFCYDRRNRKFISCNHLSIVFPML